VVDVLVAKCARAVAVTGARTLAIGGGVAANSALRREVAALAARLGVDCALPSLAYCTDNAAMIAAAGFHLLDAGATSDLALPADPALRLVVA
jgi:N6-L-threonylcarbamoyladenine synthase